MSSKQELETEVSELKSEIEELNDELDALRKRNIRLQTEVDAADDSEDADFAAAKKSLSIMRLTLELENMKEEMSVLKIGRSLKRAERQEKHEEAMSVFVTEMLPELKTVVSALAMVLTAHIKDMAPEPKKPEGPKLV